VTITDIGILLLILCVVLWAIMAALHRHTVQMEALRAQLEALQKAQHRESGEAVERERESVAKQRSNVEELTVHASRKW
jgi:hypothetical protein